MSEVDVLAQRLARLDPAHMTALLGRRPDVLRGTAPMDLVDLALRLSHPYSLHELAQTLSLPMLQVLETAEALGDPVTPEDLVALLADSGPGHRAAVEQLVAELVELAVLIPDGPQLRLPAGLGELYPRPLGLGEPLVTLLQQYPVDVMRAMQSALGLPRERTRADTIDALLAFFADPERIRAVLTEAPPFVLEWLHGGDVGAPTDSYDFDDYLMSGFDPDGYPLHQDAARRAASLGLAIGGQYGTGWQVPAEVVLAVRGPGYRAAFVPEPPPAPPGRVVDREWVEQGSSAAATAFAGAMLALLDRLARTPVPALKSGGVGARELTKLAKSGRLGDDELRLGLELAAALGLLEPASDRVRVSEGFRDWRNLEPGDQYAAVLRAWWTLGRIPTESKDEDGKVLRALVRPGDCGGCRAARQVLVAVVAELQATDRRWAADRALWQAPLVHLAHTDAADPFAAVWREAELLGVLVDGAVSRLGQVLLERAQPGPGVQDDALATIARGLLPATTDDASFGSDLTAYVVGTPSSRVTALLDSAADRESSGGAITWRFSPASIRRALDDGADGLRLADELAATTAGELPQSLRYLISDVARRHGNLRLTPATTCVYGPDVALLAQVAADRKLAKLGLRLLAPTVLAADVPLDKLMTALRANGYFPVPDDRGRAELEPPQPSPAALPVGLRSLVAEDYLGRGPGGGNRFGSPHPSTLPARTSTPIAPDPAVVAAALLSPPRTSARLPLSSITEKTVAKLAAGLSPGEIRQLAFAIDTRARVGIEYESAAGRRTRRIIQAPELAGLALIAWCELRDDERMFTLSRIVGVSAV